MDLDFTTTDPGPVAGSPTAPSSSLSVAEPAGEKQRMYIRYYFSRILSSSPCTSCRLVENFSMQYYFLSYSLSAFPCAGDVSLHCWQKVNCRRALVVVGVK